MKVILSGTELAATLVVGIVIVSAASAVAAQQIAESPTELVRHTVQREVAASEADAKVMFLNRKETPRGSQTKLMVETREGMAGMAIATNDQPLPEEQRRAEIARLAGLVNNPERLKRKQRSEKEDAERITRIVKALPDAFLYEPDGTEVGNHEVGKAGAELVRLKFRPNPKYNPPTRVEQALTGMRGYILIDAGQHRIAKIDGILLKDVSFGWGFLGHLDQGGQFLVEQGEVIPGDWELTRMSLSFTGKVLLFKSLNIKSDDVFSNFLAVPADMNFAQGVELIEKQEAELVENRQKAGTGSPK
jgi:hypothetical protein